MRHRFGTWTYGLVAATCLATGAAAQDRPATQFRNYTAPGNLESSFNLGCMDLQKASPRYNPVDLFKAVRACITAGRYDDAVRLYRLAKTYGQYDMLRVADGTAHQAVTVAQMEVLGDVSQPDQQKFSDAGKTLSDDVHHAAYCLDVARIGPPSYFPRYMIQHGMGAFIGRTGDGIVPNFDANAGWDKVLTTYLKCSAK